MADITKFIDRLSRREDLSDAEMESILDQILGQKIAEADLIRFLTLLRDKGETVGEIEGAIASLRKKAARFPARTRDLVDTCGTGGDLKGTFNISTAAAFIVAGAGIAVAKHGNRAVSSKSGSADVLKALGVNIEATPETVARCVDEVGIGFLFAPAYHSTLGVVAAARKKIGTKTIFNILGPLLNPAQPSFQVIGVYDKRLLPIVSSVLRDAGCKGGAVVHGNDGLDELTLTTTSILHRLKGGKIAEESFDPRSVGYETCTMKDLEGGSAEENALRLKKVLKGHSLPLDHCVHLNAALAIAVARDLTDFKEALLAVQESVSSGRAYQKLEALIEVSNT